MGYTSYSENTISKQLVAEYFIYIIMKYREPRFLEVCLFHYFILDYYLDPVSNSLQAPIHVHRKTEKLSEIDRFVLGHFRRFILNFLDGSQTSKHIRKGIAVHDGERVQ